jgi:hypothetical protein
MRKIRQNVAKYTGNQLNTQGCVKVAQNARFSGRHGDLPLQKPVGATLCGRPYPGNSTLTYNRLNTIRVNTKNRPNPYRVTVYYTEF